MDREAVDPGLARIVRAEDNADESVSIEGAQVRAAIPAELFGERTGAVPSRGLRIQTANPEQRNHRVVVGWSQPTDSNRHRHASREMRCRVGCTKCSRASRGSWSRRNGGMSGTEARPARGRSLIRM